MSRRRYAAHIRTGGEELRDKRRNLRKRARRWVVERTHAWLNDFRRLRVRWERKAENYRAMLHFACGLICFQAAGQKESAP